MKIELSEFEDLLDKDSKETLVRLRYTGKHLAYKEVTRSDDDRHGLIELVKNLSKLINKDEIGCRADWIRKQLNNISEDLKAERPIRVYDLTTIRQVKLILELREQL